MAHLVKCTICGVQFDRDKIQSVKVSARRYAHKRCAEEAGVTGEEVAIITKDSDLVTLENYIMKLLGEDYVGARVRKQLKEYVEEEGFTYSGIYKTLIYWYEVLGHDKDEANGGIGIVPYVYKDAYNYYYSIAMAILANEDKNIEKYKNPQQKVVEIEPPKVEVKKRIKLFNLDEE